MDSELKGKDCEYFQTKSKYIDYFELDKEFATKRTGYNVILQFSVIANKTAAIRLSPTNTDATTLNYFEIGSIGFV